MASTPQEGLEAALAHHRATRETDDPYDQHRHPLLADHNNTSFPSRSALDETYKTICGENHRLHGRLNREECYMYYLDHCYNDRYAPKVPGGGDHLSKDIWTGGAPVLEHVRALFGSQSQNQAGGSWEPFLNLTIDDATKSRQVAPETNPEVETIVFGHSSSKEVKSFLDAFNKEIRSNKNPGTSRLASSFYHLDLECVTVTHGHNPTISYQRKGKTLVDDAHLTNLPARIHLGFLNKRFDIIIPWKSNHINPYDCRGDFKLEFRNILDDLWHQLFSKLQGVAVGAALDRDISEIEQFIRSLRFRNPPNGINISFAEINVLLAIAGWNHAKTNISALNHFFTGGAVQKQWQIRCGLGRWSQPDRLPKALSCYLQSEAMAILNAANLASVCWLLHWFPTPGIAALMTGKEPKEFISWFHRLQLLLLNHAQLGQQFYEARDRTDEPGAIISKIIYSTPSITITPDDISTMIPPWRTVTFGGCESDLQALHHLKDKVLPILSKPGLPVDVGIKWDYSSSIKALAGTYENSSIGSPTNLLGCNFDLGLLHVYKNIPGMTSRKTTLRNLLRKHRDSLSKGAPEAALSATELSILYTWVHPQQALELYTKTFKGKHRSKFFELTHLVKLKPILVSYKGHQIQNKRFDRMRSRGATLKSARHYTVLRSLAQDAAPREKKQLEGCMRNLVRQTGVGREDFEALTPFMENMISKKDSKFFNMFEESHTSSDSGSSSESGSSSDSESSSDSGSSSCSDAEAEAEANMEMEVIEEDVDVLELDVGVGLEGEDLVSLM